MGMTWSDDDVRAAYFCASEVLRMRHFKSQPIPQWLRDLNNRLEVEVQVRMSRSRQQLDGAGEQLEADRQIVAAEAALILGWSKRQVQRRATDLDGEMIGGSWIFRRSTVVEYAEEMRSARVREGGIRAVPGRAK